MLDRGKILVIRGGAIGDFILTLPVFSALREYFPRTRVEVLGYPKIAQLAMAGELVHAVHPIEGRKLARFFASGVDLPDDMKRFFSSWDVIVSYLYDPERVFQENVSMCSAAQFIAGPYRPDESGNAHATASLLKPLERLTIFGADPVPALPALPGAQTREAEAAGGSLPFRLALHPGSGSSHKNWLESKWRDLLMRLVEETAWQIVLVGGEAEEERLDRLQTLVPEERLTIWRNRPLPELAEKLRRCEGFVGHDSGITHLAAAVGLPCVVLWGSTNKLVWRPLGERVHVIDQRLGLPAITVDMVMEQIMRLG